MSSRPLIAASVCLLMVLSASGAAAAPDKLGGLLANSPFGLSRAGATGSSASEPLEFRAVLEENGNRIFSIYDNTTHQSNWVDLNDPVKDFSVKEYDAENGSVTVEYQGKALKLALKRAAPVAMPAGGTAPGNRPVQVAQTQVAPQQLQQIRDEINRRRALRQQTVVPANATATPTPPNRP